MKTFLKILAGVFVVIGLGVAAVFYFTADMAAVADDFFSAVKSKDLEKARSFLSDDFKAATSKDVLNEFLTKSGLSVYKSASWANRSISGSRGTLNGTVTTEGNGAVPVKLNFAKGESGWKIYSIEKPSAGIQDEATTQVQQSPGVSQARAASQPPMVAQQDNPATQPSTTGQPAPQVQPVQETQPVQPAQQDQPEENPAARRLPSNDTQVSMVAATMHVFAVSVNEKSMTKFHAYSSRLMQNQYTVKKLDEVFAAFFNLGIDLTILDNHSPIFDEKPVINQDGILVIKGHYPTQPSQVFFEQKYIYEGMNWKVLGLHVNVK
jgi:hypothetical protein